MRFLESRTGLGRNELRLRLHKLKAAWGLKERDRVTICLDDGLVYVSASGDEIGSLHDP